VIKLKSLLTEVSETKARSYFRKELWDDFTNAARYKKDKHFYNDLVKIVKKSKFYPHAGKNEITLHGKMVFDKAFDQIRIWYKPPNKRHWYKDKKMKIKNPFYYNSTGWERYIKDFVEVMEMYSE